MRGYFEDDVRLKVMIATASDSPALLELPEIFKKNNFKFTEKFSALLYPNMSGKAPKLSEALFHAGE